MPTYAYACKDCGHRFDAVQSFAEPSLTVCPVCGGPLRKQYGSIGVTFNGSGFYRTDSRAGEKKGTDAAGAGSGNGGGTAGSGSSSKDGSGGSSGGSGGDSGSSSSPSKPDAKPAPSPST